MKANRITALLLTVLMAFSASACGQTESGGSTAGGDSATGNGTSTATCEDTGCVWDPYTPCKETVTLTVGIKKNTGDAFEDGDDYTNNYFTRYVKENVNVKIDSAWEVDAANYDQKVALDLGSGEMPDVMVVDRSIFRQLVDADMIWDLTDVYEKCALDKVKEVHASYGDRLMDEVTINEKLMGIPGTQIAGQHNLVWVRKDWLDALGMSVPKTLEEIENVAKAFVEQDPGNNGTGKTMGLTTTEDIVGEYNTAFGLYSIFNYFDAYPQQWIEVDGEVNYGSVQPEMKAALERIHQWYEEGILDKEFAIRKDADRQALVASGQVGMLFCPWWGSNGIPESVKNNPDAEWAVVAAPLDADGNLKVYANDPVNGVLVVSKAVKHPEAAIKAFNAAWEMGTGNGKGKEAFEENNTKKEVKTGVNPLHIQLDYENGVERAMTELAKGVEARDPSVMDSIFRLDWSYKCMIDELDNPGENVDSWHEWFIRTEGSAAASYENTIMKDVAFYGSTDTMSQRWANLEKLETETLMKIITGEESIDSFDKFVETWKGMGGEQIIEEVRADIESRQ